MSSADPLAGMVVPDRVRSHTEKHLVRIGRGESADDIRRAQERAEGFVEGLEVAGALNAATIEALYIAVDHAATARQIELER